MKFTVKLFFLFYVSLNQGFAQQYSKWRSYLPNNKPFSLACQGNKILAGGPQTFFSYDVENSSLNYLSKISGFSRSSISKLGYSEQTNAVVIAYDNSMIDLLIENEIIPVYEIYRSNIVGSKKVNHLHFYGDYVFISTDYGLIIYNIQKRQLVDICKYFNESNTVTTVTSTTVYSDTIVVATNKGLFKCPVKEDVNKLNYLNWINISTTGIAGLKSKFVHLSTIGNRFYAATAINADDEILGIYENGVFVNDSRVDGKVFRPPGSNKFLGLKTVKGNLYIMQAHTLIRYNEISYEIISDAISAIDVTVDKNNDVWFVDPEKGLNKLKEMVANKIVTNGPFSSTTFHLYQFQNKMMVLDGGYNFSFFGNNIQPFHFSVIDDGIWKNYYSIYNGYNAANDAASASFNTLSNKLYLASYSNGFTEYDLNTGKHKFLNHFIPGVPLHGSSSFRGDSIGNSSCRVPDLATDSKGKLWVLNTPDPIVGHPSIFTYDLNGRWDSVSWSGRDKWGSYYTKDGPSSYSPLATGPYFLHRVFIDKNDNKWFASRTYSLDLSSLLGLYVFNESKHRLPRHLKYQKDHFNEICGSQVFCIQQDMDGAIWIGTDNGVCYFSDPEEVFQLKPVKATVPVINNQPLLKGITITGIDVDGSNRKWISTLEEGVFLVSSDGTKIIEKFTETNSPLAGKAINDIKVNKNTGEVFIATNDGVFSYRGNSISGEETNGNVIAYPNPVKKEFTGDLTVDGLVNKAIIKITDMAGLLVYEGKAEGSRFTWNLKDYNGHKPLSGIYLLYSSKEDGSEQLMTKIAILD